MDIKISDLELMLVKIAEYLHSLKIDSIKIDEDSYLIIGSDEWNNILSINIKPDIGSLKDDWTSIKKNIFERQIITSVDLDRLSSILRAISQRINPI
jgi:hypothetical protein